MNGLYVRLLVIFFEDTLSVKIFLGVCLLVLAVYLFFLQGKVYILGFNLEKRSGRSRKIKPLRGGISTYVATDLVTPSMETNSIIPEFTAAPVPESQQPVLVDMAVIFPAAVDSREELHKTRMTDQIRGRYLGAEKKLKLLKILWIILTLLTVVLTFTY